MTKQANKAGKTVITLSQAEQVRIVSEFGTAARTAATAKETMAAAAKKLRDAKVVIGKSVRTCKLCQAFLTARFGEGKKPASASNILAAFRAAVNEGKAYDENKARTKAKAKAAETKAAGAGVASDDEAAETEDVPAKGKTHIGTAETATTYACTIARKGSAAKAAQTLRDLLNKMKASEEYGDLCAYLLDGLDEFDGQ